MHPAADTNWGHIKTKPLTVARMVDGVHSVVVWAGSPLKGRGSCRHGKKNKANPGGKGYAGKNAKHKGKSKKSKTPEVQQDARSGGSPEDARSGGRPQGIS